MNHAHPKLIASAENAWITILAGRVRGHDPGALASKQPLAALKFAVKDNIDVKNIPTTAACPDFHYTPKRNALVVQKLIDAGATLVGKTNLDQFACGLNGTRSPYGIVPNSFNNEFVSGGSSSGSAYVVANGEVDFALGTDTAGSGRVPAGLNIYYVCIWGCVEGRGRHWLAVVVATSQVKKGKKSTRMFCMIEDAAHEYKTH